MAGNTFTLAPLLVHSHAVPWAAREALKAARIAAPEQREAELESAARVLYRETELDCTDARELVGLAPAGSCG